MFISRVMGREKGLSPPATPLMPVQQNGIQFSYHCKYNLVTMCGFLEGKIMLRVVVVLEPRSTQAEFLFVYSRERKYKFLFPDI